MENYYILAPYEPMTESEYKSRKEELKSRKVLAIVFDCKDYADFSNKYFTNKKL